MELVLGQLAISIEDSRLQKVIQQIETIPDASFHARRTTVRPLSWAIAIELPPTDPEEIDPTNRRLQGLFRLVQDISTLLGHGTYYFRVQEESLGDFWDSSFESLLYDPDIANGLPLKVVADQAGTTFFIPCAWINEYVARHYGNAKVPPAESLILGTDRLRVALNSANWIIATEGNWRFSLEMADVRLIRHVSTERLSAAN